jgi:hypothetical protein
MNWRDEQIKNIRRALKGSPDDDVEQDVSGIRYAMYLLLELIERGRQESSARATGEGE